MRNKAIAMVLALSLAVSVTACSAIDTAKPDTSKPSTGQSQNVDNSKNENDQKAFNELTLMLPNKAGIEWKYNGFAEYGHSMKIDSINKLAENKLQYLISGQVDDMSGGESKDDFGLSLEYIVTKDGIKEIIKKGDKMPHKIKELDVLRYPLAKGTTWTQTVEINGSSVELKAEIVADTINPDTNNKIVKVEYTATVPGMPNDTYREMRFFEAGKGMVTFENTFDKDIEFNYSLFTLK